MLLIIATALLPALLLGWWIYRKDSMRPEPPQMLFKAFFYGMGSAFLSLVITTIMGVMGIMVYDLGSYVGAVSTALFAAAVPEEIAKLTMLWIFLRKNPYYDEYFDGIVYAACVGLGFAGAENSKRHFGDRSNLTAACILGVPIIIHWVYDALAFSEMLAAPALSVVLNILFVLLIWRVYKSTMRRIGDLQQQDHARMTPPPVPGSHRSPIPPPLPGSGNANNNNTPLA